jgi:hypothetical protein
MSSNDTHDGASASHTSRPMTRRAWLGAAGGGAVAALVGGLVWRNTAGATRAAPPSGAPLAITVHSSPTCGCCHKWVEHLEQNGFVVTVDSIPDVSPHKRRLGVPQALWSCHTAVVAGYAIEGHVPADLVRRLVAERPPVLGVAAPGMPNGSPGMEGFGKDRYEVLTFDRAGATEVYAVR